MTLDFFRILAAAAVIFGTDPSVPANREPTRIACEDLARLLRECRSQGQIDCVGFESLYRVDCAGEPDTVSPEPVE